MNNQGAIIVTGAAGFIGSCMVQYLNEKGYENLILADAFDPEQKKVNWQSKRYRQIVERSELFNWLATSKPEIDFVFHLGARTDTTEFDYSIHQELNVDYSINMWNYCVANKVPLVYASSAATYGGGERGYNDDHAVVHSLQPLNPYGISKNEFDKWVLDVIAAEPANQPPFWAGLKFFNVYGPNEYHKGRMASVIWHSFNQIKSNGSVKLLKSHRPDFEDGQQLRDFVYVKDVIKVLFFLMETASKNGAASAIFNLGTGKARSFYDLAAATFSGLDLEPNINFIDMPEDIRDKYQYFTEANMQKLKDAGYTQPFYSLEEGVTDYVRNYLAKNSLY
ncbi:ADP-glyceromanno-heptose 6-epimerase [soil metagenome]